MVDYSKWEDCDTSSDEDEDEDMPEPLIPTPALVRWRQKARVMLTREHNKEKEELEQSKFLNNQLLKEVRESIETAKMENGDITDLEIRLEHLIKEEDTLKEAEEELQKREGRRPLFIDIIREFVKAKSYIHLAEPRQVENLSEEETKKRMQQFIKENEKLLKEFGMLSKYEESEIFLTEHHHLVCENTANYLVTWCINLEADNESMLSEHVAHQCICLLYILRLSSMLNVDPRSCVSVVFSKLQTAEPDYMAAFHVELKALNERVKKRAYEEVEAAYRKYEEEERQARLGPGGLDPVEVFESLPPDMKICFEEEDVPMLQSVISDMPPEEGNFHMRRCVDSGLWVVDEQKSSKYW